MAIATELGYMRVNHEVDALSAMGVNTDYVLEAAQYPGILGRGYAPLSEFNEKFRGASSSNET